MQRLIVGLGNPGSEYACTRHNLGYMVVSHFCEKEGGKFRYDLALQAKIVEMKKYDCVFALPVTYMNRSGLSVKACIKRFGLTSDKCLIVCDDLDIPFGTLRLRKEGGSGGHNGLKSVEFYLQSSNYCRLRLGIGRPPEGYDVAEYVLEKFSEDERALLPEFIEKAALQISSWVTTHYSG